MKVAGPLRGANAPSRPVTSSVTVVVHRALAGYCVFELIAGSMAAASQLPNTKLWWVISFVPAIWGISVAMLVQAVRRRSIRVLAGVYSVVCLMALITGNWSFGSRPGGAASWLWWTLGGAIVASGVAAGAAFAVGYAVVLAIVYAALRTLPSFGGSVVEIAVSDGLYLVVAGLPIAFTALGMIRSGAAADDLAAQVARQGLDEELNRALEEERSRLDRLIHDDVLTTLIAAAHAEDVPTVAAARELAVATLAKVDELPVDSTSGLLPWDVLIRLADETVRRVSPIVEFVADPGPSTLNLPSAQAEGLLAALREAVRNAVRHSGASVIQVSGERSAGPGNAELVFTVADNGCGFVPEAVDPSRLGIRLSIRERVEGLGGSVTIESAPGLGSMVSLSVFAARAVEPVKEELSGEVTLPAEFPTTQLIALAWVAATVQLGQGIFYVRGLPLALPSVLGIVSVGAAIAILLHGGRALRLSAKNTAIVAALTIAAAALQALALPQSVWPGYAFWMPFLLQLIIVILVLRQRGWVALGVFVGSSTPLLIWAVQTTYVSMAVGTVLTGPGSFAITAWFVNRALLRISRRQALLRQQEAAAVRQAARRHVGLVQRALWIDDLRSNASALLQLIASADPPLGAEIRAECLLLEATLRESLLARNLMTEELAELTERARRRGVSITFVDSRTSPTTPAVNRALLAEIRAALASQSVSRVVVRVAPERDDQSASVVASDATSTILTRLDRGGRRVRDDHAPKG